ncbi:ribonuclease III [Trichodelitschia bisporula]|uniref:Ribonuclease III n=1 Tax=Trichodelitschia bisporula TaxID=703511 RepID=A0A6G1I575_9PEZI|nr:ribonuclease III [Trichodelitschia bisporula]
MADSKRSKTKYEPRDDTEVREPALKRRRHDDNSKPRTSPDISTALQDVIANGSARGYTSEIIAHATELQRLLKPTDSNQDGDQNKNETRLTNSNMNAYSPPLTPALTTLNARSPADNSKFGTIPPMPTAKTPLPADIPPLPAITDPTLTDAPFTHTSMLPAHVPPTSTNTYEPLEFLGDAYLEVIATRLIHARFAGHSVGQKAGLRELLIKNDTLASYAEHYGFPDRVKTTKHERSQGGKTWSKILADVFEAYVACVILSDPQHGFDTAEQWLTALWAPKVLEWRARGDGKVGADEGLKSSQARVLLAQKLLGGDAKLEYLQERPMEVKNSRTTFFIAVYLTGWGYTKQYLGRGSGRSKTLASAEAASNALEVSGKIIDTAHKRKCDALGIQPR